MGDLAWLRLQLEWGADEALAEQPVDRRAVLRAVLHAGPAAGSAPAAEASRLLPAPAAAALAQAAAGAAQTVPALRTALEQFEGCALRMTATNLVFAEGDPASRHVLVADVPGAAEDRAGNPFAGPAGLFLDRMLASAGLDRASWQSISLLPWRPPGDRKPTEAEIQACLPFFLRHLTLIQPRLVVLLGGLAAKTLLPGDGRRGRGAWQTLTVPGLAESVPCLALPSPAHIRATASAKREAWAALLRVRRALDAAQADHD